MQDFQEGGYMIISNFLAKIHINNIASRDARATQMTPHLLIRPPILLIVYSNCRNINGDWKSYFRTCHVIGSVHMKSHKIYTY
jgi:hypothetical protein